MYVNKRLILDGKAKALVSDGLIAPKHSNPTCRFQSPSGANQLMKEDSRIESGWF
jgi:hypothetical protein